MMAVNGQTTVLQWGTLLAVLIIINYCIYHPLEERKSIAIIAVATKVLR